MRTRLHVAMATVLERCPRPACTGRAYAHTPGNAHTPGP